MANFIRTARTLVEQTNFRHIHLIEQLTDQQLEEHQYYRGFPCPHGHVVRDADHHWCYACVKKILSNVCGFDINYLHPEYKLKYSKLWKQIQIASFEDCWPIVGPTGTTPKRICLPSYRSEYSHQKAENVNIHKAIYQCAWGDIGAMVVTRECGNPSCGNPLHLISSWNRIYPPQIIAPFDLEFKAEKLMLYSRQKTNPKLSTQGFKNTIAHPLAAKEPPENHEEYSD